MTSGGFWTRARGQAQPPLRHLTPTVYRIAGAADFAAASAAAFSVGLAVLRRLVPGPAGHRFRGWGLETVQHWPLAAGLGIMTAGLQAISTMRMPVWALNPMFTARLSGGGTRTVRAAMWAATGLYYAVDLAGLLYLVFRRG